MAEGGFFFFKITMCPPACCGLDTLRWEQEANPAGSKELGRAAGFGAEEALRGRCAALRGRSPTKVQPQPSAWKIAAQPMLFFSYRLKFSTSCGRKEIVYKPKWEPGARPFPCEGGGTDQAQIRFIPIKPF